MKQENSEEFVRSMRIVYEIDFHGFDKKILFWYT